jgi:hypothetical protein
MRGGILAMCELHKLDASFKPALFHLKYPHVFTFQNAKRAVALRQTTHTHHTGRAAFCLE